MKRFFTLSALALLAGLSLSQPVMAQDSVLAAAKQAGLVGERADGLIGPVDGSAPADIQALVARINDERQARYSGIAASTGESLDKIRAVAGDRLLQATPPGQYVMNAAGRWVKK
jgi:uncharacterized protein